MRIPDLSFLNRRSFERNRLRNFEEARLGVEEVGSGPVRAFVEFTTRCPFGCPQCYRTVSVRRNQWMSADMSDQILDELCRELFPRVFYLLVSGTGELFASERWLHYLRVLDGVSAHKEIVTAGMNLGPVEVAELARRKLLLTVSMDGTSQRSFDLYRKGVSYEQVVEGIARFVRAGGHRLKLNYTVMAGNLAEVPDAVRLCGRLGVGTIDFAPLQVTEPLVADEEVAYDGPEAQAAFREAVAVGRELRIDLGLPMGGAFLAAPPPSTRFRDEQGRIRRGLRTAFRRDENHAYVDVRRCAEPWTTILVNVFGDVAPCSVRAPIGHLHRERLPAIWNGEAIRGLRKELLAGRSPGRCATCPKNPQAL